MLKKNNTTKIRNLINEALANKENNSLSFQDINNYLLSKGEKVNKSTIYRYIDKLILENKLQKYSNENGKGSTYVLLKSVECCNNHLHMKCLNCNKIIHLDCKFNQQILDHLKSQHGFEVDCTQTIIYGLCQECANNQNN